MERTIAKQADLEATSRTIARAFATDPVWAVALARPDGQTDHHESYWRLFVEGAAAHGTVF